MSAAFLQCAPHQVAPPQLMEGRPQVLAPIQQKLSIQERGLKGFASTGMQSAAFEQGAQLPRQAPPPQQLAQQLQVLPPIQRNLSLQEVALKGFAVPGLQVQLPSCSVPHCRIRRRRPSSW